MPIVATSRPIVATSRVGLAAWYITALLIMLTAATVAARGQSTSWNPHPTSGDIVLPMPGETRMVFVKVPVPGKGAFGGVERIFQLGGDKQVASPFQYPRQMRIGPTFRAAGGEGFLVVGRYEVTIGQYAALLGDGDMAKGLKHLAENSEIEQLAREGAKPEEFAADQRFLARALHGLSVDDLHDFIARYNAWCLTTAAGRACLAAMRKGLGAPGFFRLPAEPEWEYVARGGATGARAPAALPFPDAELAAHANVASKRRQPDEIGKLKAHPTLPIHDLFGNVSELTAGPFSLDNGTGAFGGGVARGGNFKTEAAIVRSSLREEVAPYVYRDASQAFVKRRARELGLRLTVGSLQRSSNEDPQADARISEEFRTSYVPCCGVEGAADPYGNNIRAAKDIGTLALKKDIELNDMVGGPDDPADFFRFNITEFGTVRMVARAENADIIMEVKHASWETWQQLPVKAGRLSPKAFTGLLPGVIWAKVYPVNPQSSANWRVRLEFAASDCCGYSPETAKDLGIVSGQQEVADYVGAGDMTDFVKFKIERADTISVRLLELTGDADVELWDAQKKVLARSVNPGTGAEQIDLANAPAGTYFVRVFAKSDTVNARYKLQLALGAVDTAGSNRETARDVGVLTSELLNITESVGGSDTADYFRLRLTQNSIVRVQVNRADSPVSIALHDMRDGELARGQPGMINPKLLEIATGRPAGTYFIVVRSASGAVVPYTLTIEVRPAPEHGIPELAKQVVLGPAPVEYRNSLSKENQARYLTFDLQAGGLYRFELQTVRADPGANIDLLLFRQAGRDWQRLADGNRATATTSTIERQLDPGRYIVALHWNRDSRGNSADLALRISLLQGGQPQIQAGQQGGQQGGQQLVTAPPPGRVVREHKSWKVSTVIHQGRKICFAFTDAIAAQPAGWRAERPRLLIEVAQNQGGLFHSFDVAKHYRGGARFDAKVRGRAGTIPLALTEAGGELKAVEPCQNDRAALCTVIRSMQNLNRGDELLIEGQTQDGQKTLVTYSLRGYRAAITHMNDECTSRPLTGWLEQEG